MAVTLGINPITWTNDDMPELGGDIPLETCLAETRDRGLRGHRARRQVSARRRGAAADPRAARPRASSRAGTARSLPVAPSPRRSAAVAPHLDLLAAMGCTAMVFAEGHGSTDGNPAAPLSARPVLADAAWPEFCAKLNDVARHLRRARRAPRVSPPHGHRGADRSRNRSADGRHERRRRAAARHRAPGVRRRRSGRGRPAPRRAHRARALQGRPRSGARRRAARRPEFPARRPRRRVHGAGRRLDRFRRRAARAAARRLRRLAGRRGRAGPGQGASAHLRAPGFRNLQAAAEAAGFGVAAHDAEPARPSRGES